MLLGGVGGEECKAVVGAGGVLDVVDWFVVVEDGDNVSGKGEGLGVDDAVDDFFEG